MQTLLAFNTLMWGLLRLAPIIVYEKSQLNTLVWSSLTLAHAAQDRNSIGKPSLWERG